MNSTASCATLVVSTPEKSSSVTANAVPPSPKGKVMRSLLSFPRTKTFPLGGKVPPEAAEEGDRTDFAAKRGPRRSPAQRVRWGEEEQGSGRRATEGSLKRSGLCKKTRPPAKPNEVGSLGRGGARERREGDQRKPEQKRTLRRRGTKSG